MDRIDRLRIWLRQTDLVLLLVSLLCVLSIWAFLEIADAVTEGESGHIDQSLLLALRESQDPSNPIGPRWVEVAGRDITALGGLAVMVLLVGGVIGYLIIVREFRAALFVLASTLGGAMLSSILKRVYARPRPDVVPHLMQESSLSFPSGHAMVSAVVYLTLGALLARLVHGRGQKLYFLMIAMLLTLLIGVSRIYLGVHYPTDVLAGWSAGLAWASACWLTVRYLQRRGIVER